MPDKRTESIPDALLEEIMDVARREWFGRCYWAPSTPGILARVDASKCEWCQCQVGRAIAAAGIDELSSSDAFQKSFDLDC